MTNSSGIKIVAPPPIRNGSHNEGLTGYWWESVEIRTNKAPLTHKGKDYHEMSEEEYYDSLEP